MSDNGEKRYQKILEGIQYLIGDNKQLREELREFAKSAEEDRRRADEDRRRADERFERLRQESDERFQQLSEKSDERFTLTLDQVKRTNRVAVEIARDLRRQQRQLLEGQGESNRLLQAILKRLPPGPNGK